MKKIVVILTVCSVLLVYFYLHAQIQTAKGTIYVDNRERNYIVYVPVNYEKSGRKSLLIGLHGGYGQAGGMSHLTGLNDLSDLEGFLLVYPDGINRRWNDGTETIPNDVNDVAFISALIDRLIAEYRVDPKRVYVTGISNGGFLSVRLACDLSDKIAAVAPVAASLPENRVPLCKPSNPVSVLFLSGEEDPLVPYAGGFVKHRGRFGYGGKILSVPDATRFWSEKDHCQKTPASDELKDKDPEDQTRVVREIYSGCEGGAGVELYSIEGGGHTWPGGLQYLPAFLVGKTSRDIDASEVMWQFFKNHPKP